MADPEQPAPPPPPPPLPPPLSEAEKSTDSNVWEELLRKMLPIGAPVPDEDHLDYSISVEYQGPPPHFDKIPSRSSSPIKPPKFNSSFKKHRSPLLFSDKNKLSPYVFRDNDDFRINGGNSDVENGSSLSPCSSNLSNFHVITVDKVGNEVINDDHVVSARCGSSDNGVDKAKTTACSRCRKRVRLMLMRTWGERCLVCDSMYCRSCVLKAMGSMPEGRKCLGCIGKPIDEAKRDSLGKFSRMLAKAFSPLEVRQILKAEKECLANQIRPEQVVVNGRPLRAEELAEILGSVHPPRNLRPGRYWYDKDSGLWGKEGEKPDRIISAKLNMGGKLLVDASNGGTKVYINGREITKLELRLLRLAKVQCPRDTHFWLYEDGSYEEEGQNNIKGNIWGKAFTRLICSLFSLPLPPGNPHGPKEDPTTFSGRSVPEYLELGKAQKLLLLGMEGSGSSTIFKQMKFIHGNKFTAEELEYIKHRIQNNIYRYLSILLEGREHFEDESFLDEKTFGLTAEKPAQGETFVDGQKQCIYSINERFKNFSDWILCIMATGDLDSYFPAAAREYAAIVDEVWKDPAIQETYKRREELHCLPEVAKYFLDRAIDISSNQYEPSEEDILNAEGVTPINGLASFEFKFGDCTPMPETYTQNFEFQFPLTKYQLIRVGSKVIYDGCKWLEMLQGFSAVVFCVALSDYDQVLAHGTSSLQNKMLASRDLFEIVARHDSFKDIPFVLILNKYDAFEEKIKQVHLGVCEWFHDFRPLKPHHRSQSLAHQAYFYVAMKFKELYTSITSRKLFVWQTRARDRASVNEAFMYIQEVIKWNEEKNRNRRLDVQLVTEPGLYELPLGSLSEELQPC